MYFTTGSNNVVLVTEVPDGSDAVALGMAVAATGSLAKIETVRAWTPTEFKSVRKSRQGWQHLHTARTVKQGAARSGAVHRTPRRFGRRAKNSGRRRIN